MPSRGSYCTSSIVQSLVLYLETCMDLLTVAADISLQPTYKQNTLIEHSTISIIVICIYNGQPTSPALYGFKKVLKSQNTDTL